MMYNQAQNPIIRKLINQDLNKAKDFSDKASKRVKEVGGSVWDRVKSLFD